MSRRINLRKQRKRQHIYERDGYTCKLCRAPLTPETATLDHVIPRSKGGSGAVNNLVTACRTCNQKKGDKLMRDYGYEWNHWEYRWEKRST
jgi:5-methylcytosine-specific restriction endonuclease McrA